MRIKILVLIAAIFLVGSGIASAFTPSGLLEIHYINVGWGTSVLVIGPNGTTILMDGGRDNMGTTDVIPYLESLGIMPSDGLSYIMASHQHSDHITGLTEVMNGGYDVHLACYYNGSNYSNSYVTAFRTAASHTTAGPLTALTLGTVIQLGDGATATCACADGSVWGSGPVSGAQSDENDRSIGLLIRYNDFSFLYAGDLGGGDSDNSCTGRSTSQVNVETPLAQAIMPGGAHPMLNSYGLEVLHVNHHGSESSTNPTYVNLLTPRIACIATGNGQSTSYMFPRHDVVDNVLLAGVSCVTAPPAIVLQSEEGQPAGSLTSYSGYCLGDILIKTNGQRLFQVAGSGRLHEGPDERAALGLPRYYPLDEDTTDHTLPGAISNLSAAGGPTNSQITLRWTASGDDGATGQAALYDIRYVLASSGAINTDTKWNAATKINSLPFPKTSGTAESLIVSGLASGQSYYFAMKTTDDNLNLSALSNSPLGTAGQSSGNIAGTVTDIKGVVPGVIVNANDGLGHSGIDTTNSSGFYLMPLPPGTYSVIFNQNEHRDTTMAGVVITSGGTTTANMVMARLKGSIAGTVTSGGVGAVGGVRVVIIGTGKEDTTDANGLYALSDLVDSTYTVSFSNPNYSDTVVTRVVITPNHTTTLNMIMRKIPGWLSGIIVDTTGSLLDSVHIRIAIGAIPIDSVFTNAQGEYLSMIAWGNYNVSFSKSGYRDTAVTGVTILMGDTTILSLSMTPINYTPVINSAAIDTATEYLLFKYVATATDQNGTIPVISISNYPGWLNVIGDTISGIAPNLTPDTTFRIIASDGQSADTLIVSVLVIPVNDPPQITSPDSAVAIEHQMFSYTATATDPDGTLLSISFRYYDNWLHVAGSTISGIPPENPIDTSFLAIASDGQLADTQLVRIRVIPVNDPPVLTSPDSVVAVFGIQFTYNAIATDPENATVSIIFDHYPSWLSVDNQSLVGIPPDGSADTTFWVIISDGQLTDSAMVWVVVQSTCAYLVGDINGDHSVLGGDVTFGVRYLKGIGLQPPDSCYLDSASTFLYIAGDCNGDCLFRGSDISKLVGYFKGAVTLLNCPYFPQAPIKMIHGVIIPSK